jgi:hypothetical protein
MSPRGSITLGKLEMLEVACHRCDRRGRLGLARLIAEHGAGTGLPELRTILAGDCRAPQPPPSTTAAASTTRSCPSCSRRVPDDEIYGRHDHRRRARSGDGRHGDVGHRTDRVRDRRAAEPGAVMAYSAARQLSFMLPVMARLDLDRRARGARQHAAPGRRRRFPAIAASTPAPSSTTWGTAPSSIPCDIPDWRPAGFNGLRQD